MPDNVSLRALIENYPIKSIVMPGNSGNIKQALDDIKISGLNYHSQNVSQNELFFCLTGHQYDGHAFAEKAYNKGAVALIVEREIPHIPLLQVVVENSRRALSHLSAKFYQHPSKSMNMIGITSTNGKTTTTYMIDQILSSNKPTGLLGTVIVKLGEETKESDLTTPESLDLQRYLASMKRKNINYCTMEVSSSGLELERVSAVDYDIAIINNISRDHIDQHGSFENYFAAKQRLVEEIQEDKRAVINVDCENACKMINYTKAKVITYSVKGIDATIGIDNLDLSSGSASFDLVINRGFSTLSGKWIKPGRFKIKLKVLGLHNVYNATSAAISTLLLDEPITRIQSELAKFSGVERRFQLIFDKKFKIIDDHFANPGNIEVTMETLGKMDFNNLKILYAIRGGRGKTVNEENTKALIKWLKKLNLQEVYVTSSDEIVGIENKVTMTERDTTLSLLKSAGIRVRYFSQLRSAIKSVIIERHLQTGDVLLLAGCQGMDPGARLVLNLIYNRLTKNQQKYWGDEILAPLKHRVAGMNCNISKPI
ncbi:Mur ligase family protein [Natranaerobius thermophilus]|uniref:UDP-N-acetylmuramyl-tripeptide synthetase n=1 Tax=Natranaerobius thermophilus (strain ATCC BAA-1301 / DSM 18059 / JW/NM-WN-LF) TaxID=457570 RepID=B2A4K2_NATTJ|nr:UDP-N-acetylmuramyl-tripeptide synthetase [Natranaerobius thermophilus]ACB85177.1 UDP-N-acetylmuramyl-tripeptide synthetase [Natranaerobius thermophilus JW/NM-WN-LF]